MSKKLEIVRRTIEGKDLESLNLLKILEQRHPTEKGHVVITEFFVAPATPLYDPVGLKAFGLAICTDPKPDDVHGFWARAEYHFGELRFIDRDDTGESTHETSIRIYPSVAVGKHVIGAGMAKDFMRNSFVEQIMSTERKKP